MYKKTLLNQLIIFQFVIYGIQSCQKGCLVCDFPNCKLCDFQNHYFLKDNICQQNIIEQCQVVSIEGNCLQCHQDYLLTNNSCVSNYIENKIENCIRYDNTSECIQCSKEYYLKDQNCIQLTNHIEYCEVQKSNDICMECYKGFYLLENKCYEKRLKQNCSIYSNKQCIQCKEQYVLEQNTLKLQLIQQAYKQDYKVIFDIISLDIIQDHIQCKEKIIDYCLEYQDFSNCKKCQEGYLLNNGLCIIEPHEIIQFCKIQKNYTQCQQCDQGYHLNTQYSCIPNKNIQNCLVYLQDSFTTQCKQCQDDFYLKDNVCIQRQYYIENCFQYELTQDNCKKCVKEFQLLKEQSKCVHQIQNCQYSTWINDKLLCQQCKDRYYLNNNICLEGSIQNCLSYQNINKCNKCDQKFYVTEDGLCIQHDLIEGCEQYSDYQKNICEKCQNDQLIINTQHICRLKDNQFCELYDKNGKCLQCIDDYNLNIDNKCIDIQEPSNCLRQILGECIKCKQNFEYQDKNCVKPNYLIEFNCDTIHIKFEQNQQDTHCTECQPENFPYFYKYITTCQNVQENQQIKNCIKYQQINNRLNCIQCNQDSIVSSNGKCVEQCQQNQQIRIGNYIIDNNDYQYIDQRYCIENLIEGCQLLAYFILDNKLVQRCVQCQDSYIAIINNQNIYQPTNFIYQQQVECLKDTLPNRSQQYCKYYQQLPNNNYECIQCDINYTGSLDYYKEDYCTEYSKQNYKCIKCVLGKALKEGQCIEQDQDDIANCEVYSFEEQICNKCSKGYILNQDQKQCLIIDIKSNCKLFDQNNKNCLKCIDGYIYNDELKDCVKYIQNCIVYKNIEQCLKCDQGYFLNEDSQFCQQGSIDNCLFYEDITGLCIQYKNLISLKLNNQCKKINVIQDCIQYNDNQECIECKEGYYIQLYNQQCCQYQYYSTGCLQKSQTCKELQYKDGIYKCTNCVQGYYLQQDRCIQNSYYDYNGLLTNKIKVETNEINCLVYDYQHLKCQVCKENYYLSFNNCCQNDYYFNQETCQSITQIKNCIQINNYINDIYQCQLCKVGYQLLDNQCHKLEQNCLSLNHDKICQECEQNYYLINSHCCPYNYYLNDNNQCQKLQDGNLKYCKMHDEKCIQCRSGYVLIDSICIQITNLYSSCLSIENDNLKCSKCKTNYTLFNGVCCQSQTQIFNQEEGMCEDINIQQCEQGYYLNINDTCCPDGAIFYNNQCINVDNIFKNCLYLDKELLKCIKCRNNDYHIEQGQCVQNGFSIQNNQIVKNTILNCKLQNNGQCLQCNSRYVLKDNECTEYPQNCLQMNVNQQNNKPECNKCINGYLLNILTMQCIQNSSDIRFINCEVYDGQQCKTCKNGYYVSNKFCCEYGTFYNGNFCDNIKVNNCSIFIDNNCKHCKLYDGISQTQILYSYKFFNNNQIYQIQFQTNPNQKYYYQNYILQNNSCCKLGQNFNQSQNKCLNNTILNCLIQNNQDCLACKDEFYLTNNNKNCCKYDEIFQDNQCIKQNNSSCLGDYYLSNNHCCKQNYFWSQKLNKCQPLLDENCLQSSSNNYCDLCIDSKYPSVVNNVEIQDFINNKIFYAKFCQDINFTQAIDQGTMEKLDNQCKIPDLINGTCQKCMQESYKIFEDQKCCKEGYTLQNINGYKQCIEIISIANNCINFNYKEMKCNECIQQYNLDLEFCCPQNYFYNDITKECDIYNKGCIQYDHQINQCKQCQDNHYIHMQQCCELGQYFDQESQVCKTSQVCLQFIQDSNICQLCKEGYYLTNNYCCQYGYYYNGVQCKQDPQDDLTSGLTNCLQYGQHFECIVCHQDMVLTNGKCCQSKQYFDGQQCQQYIANCNEVNDKNECIVCENGLKPQNNLCCGIDEFYLTLTQQCHSVQFYTQCKNFNTEGCFDCETGYISIWNNKLQYYECTIQTFAVIQHCLRYFNTGQCKQCKPLHSLSYDKKACIQVKEDRCQRYDYEYKCQQCLEGDVLFEGECIKPERSCLIFESQDKIDCLRCHDYYYRDLYDFQCYQFQEKNIQQKIPNCLYAHYFKGIDGDEQIFCEECQQNYYLQNNRCIYADIVQNCIKYSNSNSCTKCQENFYVLKRQDSQNECCQKQQFNHNSQCQSNKDLSINNCKFYKSQLQNQHLQIQCQTCKDQYYLYNDVCCPLGTFLKNSQCINSLQDSLKNCLQFKDENNCNEAVSQSCKIGYYLSFNKCCQYGQYYDQFKQSCQVIDIEYCVQINNEFQCIECQQNTILYQNTCCLNNQFYDIKQNKCVNKGLNCQVNKIEDGQCTQCVSSNHYIQGQHCCLIGQYYNQHKLECEDITQLDNCDQGIIISDEFQCKKCKQNYILFDNKKCCNNKSILINDMCIQKQQFKECLQFNKDGMCIKCVDNYYLSSSYKICCLKNQYFDVKNQQCVNTTIEKCQKQNNQDQCLECIGGYYLVNQNTNCCKMGQKWDGLECKDTDNLYCQKFDFQQNNLICTKCYTGYNLYYKQKGTICCQDGYYFNEQINQQDCIPFNYNLQDCLSLQLKRPVCQQCTGYISDHYCCQKSQYFYQGNCLNIQQKQCLQYSHYKQKCLQCIEGYYISNGSCCKEGQYYNMISNICESNDMHKDLQNCLQIDNSLCKKCSEEYHLFKGQCYDKNQTNSDINIPNSLNNCLNLDMIDNQITCNKCEEQYYLSNDKRSCCSANQIIYQENCINELEIPVNCIKWDQKLLQCKQCDTKNTYLQQEQCVQYGYFLNQEGQLQMIDIQQCIQVDVEQEKCLKCNEDYYLDNKNQCQQLPNNCQEYDTVEQSCIKCIPDYYLSDKSCCQQGYYFNNNQCQKINEQKNCNKFTDGQCIECANDYLLQNGQCCQQDYYYSIDQQVCIQSNIKNCLNFNQYGDCKKCKINYLFVGQQNSIQNCIEIPIQQCEVAKFDEQHNQISCVQCKNQNQQYYIVQQEKEIQYIYQQVPANCDYIQISSIFKESTLQCQKCLQNNKYYLNENKQCILRQNTQNCKKNKYNYIDDKDQCLQCLQGYYLYNQKCQKIQSKNCLQKKNNLCIECQQNTNLLWKQKNNELISYCYQIEDDQINYLNNPTYINQCQEIYTQCTEQRYINLQQDLDLLFNCQICKNGYIPFAISSIKNDNFYLQKQSIEQEQSSTCIKIDQISIIDNCALALQSYDIDQQINVINCVACKPGYQPIRSKLTNQYIDKCEFINYCKEPGLIVNGCEQCQQNYVQKRINNNIDFTQCIQANDENINCKIINQNNKCTICNDGYFLTQDQQCIGIKNDLCQSGLQNTQLQSLQSLKYTQLTDNKQSGCLQCKLGKLPVINNFQNYICLQKKEHDQNINCQRFGVQNGRQICTQCNKGYINGIGVQCINQGSSLKGCELAQSQQICLRCKENYILINHKCQQKFIDNCKVYDEQNNNQQICLVCQNKFYLKDNQCIKGQIKNCIKYQQEKCIKCEDKHVLLKGQNGFYQCMKIDLEDNCLQYTQNQMNNHIQCSKCEDNYYAINEQIKFINSCQQFNDIPFCIKYEEDIHLPKSQFNCKLCDKGYYLDNNQCKQRKNSNKNCQEQYIEKDECEICNEGYFFNKNNNACIENNSGIQNCAKYQSLTKCRTCKNLYFLKQNQCQAIDQQNVVVQCISYDQNQKCQQCEEYYFLKDNLCVENTIENCKLQLGQFCQQCVKNYYLNEAQQCKQILGIQNCKIQDQNQSKKCIQCQNDYYPQHDQCLQVTNKIKDCEIYGEDMRCEKCLDNYYLNLKGQCENNDQDTNCVNTKETIDQCILCESGYKLSSQNICVEDIDGSQMEGCFLGDNKDPGLCLICKFGYYHDENLICQKNELVQNRGQSNDEINSTFINFVFYIALYYTLFQIQLF